MLEFFFIYFCSIAGLEKTSPGTLESHYSMPNLIRQFHKFIGQNDLNFKTFSASFLEYASILYAEEQSRIHTIAVVSELK